MKKTKLLKSVLIPTLGFSAIGSIAAVCTSCGNVHVQYSLVGGSLDLQYKPSTAGEDNGVWKLRSEEDQEIESVITWELISATTEELPDSIKINDGLVSWTDQIENGKYEFYVVATYIDNETYNDNEIRTNKISLTTHSYELMNDLEETILYYDKGGSEEPKYLKNWYLYDETNQSPIPQYECQYSLETFGYSSVFSIDEYGFLSWNKSIALRDFNFQVICLYKNLEFCSEIYTLSVFDTSIFRYVLNSDNCSYTILSYPSVNYGEFNVLNLPTKYLGLPINKIGDNFLSGCTSFNNDITNLQNVTSIGDNFLSGCTSFNHEIDLKNITSIGDNFLSGCTSFNKDIDLQNVTSIGDNFLSGCTSFNNDVTRSLQNITSIGDNFLSGCTSFNNDVTRSLQNITSIGDNFLSGCTSFNKDIDLQNITSIGDNFLSGCTSLNYDTIHLQNVTTIGDNFLSGCTSFNNGINLQNVTTIGDNFLSGCTRFDNLIWGLWNITSIGDNFLSGCTSFNNGINLQNVTTIGDNFLSGCTRFDGYINFQNITSIGHNFLSGCTRFNCEIDLKNIITIGDNFLSGCSSLTELTIPKTVNYIGGGSFYNCYSIKCLKIMCPISSFQSSELSFSVDDMTCDAYENGLKVFVKDYKELKEIRMYFGDIYDVENKIFRSLITRLIS